MARFKGNERNEPKLDMTPMIDVIFQLIIFFMCSIKFKTLEGKLASYLPKDSGINSSIPIDPKMDEIRIKLVYDDSMDMNTKILVKPYGADAVRITGWKALSSDIGARHTALRAQKLEWPFIIDPDSKVPMQAVVSALDACRSAGVEDVRFAAKSPVTDELSGLGTKANKWDK
ncbi:MAG: biopolymer transporter ExbD [Planctomycetes bacterium]|nr:biopolymer transporter ExbD [Planctomycetota bacterium]